MKNPRVTVKEWNLLKGALRRVFARCELKKAALARVTIPHEDSLRPRVTLWGYCETCGVVTPRYLLEVDHKIPFVEIGKTFIEMTLEEAVDRLWCELDNLSPICKPCHYTKTRLEAKKRLELRKALGHSVKQPKRKKSK